MNNVNETERQFSRWNRFVNFMAAVEQGSTERQDTEIAELKKRVEILEQHAENR